VTDSLDFWASHALNHQWCRYWTEGAIFPRELAYFFSECDDAGITHIVECGRQDGYSTHRIAEYLIQRRNADAYSIDYAPRISGIPIVRQHSGDAFALLPKIIEWLPAKAAIALLIDGPKDASGFALACSLMKDPRIRLYAFHNRKPGDMISEVTAGDLLYYEQWACGSPRWSVLTAEERKLKAARSLTQSSLAITTGSPRLARLWRREFHLYQPAIVRAVRFIFGDNAARHLFLLSFRIWGS
jgi:hypothetical protein